MDILVLGGTHHVGRAVVEVALAGGHRVTALNRGLSGALAAGAEAVVADRTRAGELRAALDGRRFDAVVDTWSGAPAVVDDSARALAGAAGHYTYVSSRSVYRWPIAVGLDESGPVVDGDPAATDTSDYAALKRGGELAALEGFGALVLLARAGLILGPYERVGRLPWWLRRLERGGRCLAPGPPDRPLQYVDGRDLAEWIVAAAARGLAGTFDTVSAPGHTTMAELLAAAQDTTGGSAELVWAPADRVLAAGVEPWTELPIWLPPGGEAEGLYAGDTSAAQREGLHCRPVVETVDATWAWLQAEGDPASLADGSVGLDPEREAAILAELS
jgi:2'-hydroxyisoflavone reductase